MQTMTLTATSCLAIIGMVTSIAGLMNSDIRMFLIGGVLLAGAGVFALLHIGTRSRSHEANQV